MLNLVPAGMRQAARQMVIRHGNSMDCTIYRKVVARTVGTEAGTMGNLPTMGGLGVTEAEDETEVDYQPLGEGKILFGGVYEKTNYNDAKDSAEQQQQSEALFEPTVAGDFELRKSDLVMAMPGGGVVIPYEVAGVINNVNIPPYVPKYVLVPQGELMFDDDIAAEYEAR